MNKHVTWLTILNCSFQLLPIFVLYKLYYNIYYIQYREYCILSRYFIVTYKKTGEIVLYSYKIFLISYER